MQRMVTESATLGGALEDIEAFVAVIELGSISAAARRLGEAKGGISRRISRLEKRLGVALLVRTARAVTPTDEGLAFHRKSREALDLLAEAGEEARGSRSLARGHLRITAPHDIGLNVLPRLLVRFRATYPQITAELLLDDTLLDLAAHRIDLALRASGGGLPDTAYRARALIDFHIALFASPHYLHQQEAPRIPEDLEEHSIVVSRDYGGGAARLQLHAVSGRRRTAELTLQSSFRSNDYAGVHRLLLAGAGIGALPDIDAAEDLASGHLVRVLAGWHVGQATLYAITVQGRQSPARVRAFMEFAGEELGSL